MYLVLTAKLTMAEFGCTARQAAIACRMIRTAHPSMHCRRQTAWLAVKAAKQQAPGRPRARE